MDERDHAMRIQDLEREDRYHRERYALYRAKARERPVPLASGH